MHTVVISEYFTVTRIVNNKNHQILRLGPRLSGPAFGVSSNVDMQHHVVAFLMLLPLPLVAAESELLGHRRYGHEAGRILARHSFCVGTPWALLPLPAPQTVAPHQPTAIQVTPRVIR